VSPVTELGEDAGADVDGVQVAVDVSGEDDIPWAVFVVDDYGARLLPEYSVLDEAATDAERETALRRAAAEIPGRAEAGDFTRGGDALEIPAWLRESPEGEEE